MKTPAVNEGLRDGGSNSRDKNLYIFAAVACVGSVWKPPPHQAAGTLYEYGGLCSRKTLNIT